VVGDAGDGSAFPQMPGLVYHGSLPLPKLAEMYRNCDVFVAPSTGQESFGMVLLEAMATARPIVCSAIAGSPQAADEHAARLVPRRDPGALEAAILSLADPTVRWRMGVWNRHRAESFDWEHVTSRVREEYLESIEMKLGVRKPISLPIRPVTPALLPANGGGDGAEVGRRQAGNG